MLAEIVFLSLAVIFWIFLVLMSLDQFGIWKNRPGQIAWKVWTYIFPFMMVFGAYSWWVEPLFGGPFWGRVIAAIITGWVIYLFYYWWDQWRARRRA